MGIRIFQGEANFLLFYCEENLYEKLLRRGILIRDCSNFEGLSQGYYRIAVKRRRKSAITGSNKGVFKTVIEHLLPEQIEQRSFEIIDGELKKRGIVLPKEQEMITKRVIHTTADFEYTDTLTFSKGAVGIARELLKKGADIVTDTNMALSGINKRSLAGLGGEVHCYMADETVAKLAQGARNNARGCQHGNSSEDSKAGDLCRRKCTDSAHSDL